MSRFRSLSLIQPMIGVFTFEYDGRRIVSGCLITQLIALTFGVMAIGCSKKPSNYTPGVPQVYVPPADSQPNPTPAPTSRSARVASASQSSGGSTDDDGQSQTGPSQSSRTSPSGAFNPYAPNAGSLEDQDNQNQSSGYRGPSSSGSQQGGQSGGYRGGPSDNTDSDNVGFSGQGSNRSNARAAQPRPTTYIDRAKLAFRNGNEKDAFELIQAHMIQSHEKAGDLFKQFAWSPVRSQPVLGVRIAVGVDLKGPSDLTDYKPVGTNTSTNRGGEGSGRGRTAGQRSGQRNNTAATPAPVFNGALDRYAGLMGTKVTTHISELYRSGSLGKVFQDVAVNAPQNNTGARNSSQGFQGQGFQGQGSQEGQSQQSSGSPYGANSPFGGGGPGDSNDANDSGSFGNTASQRNASDSSNASSDTQRLTPGLTFIGRDSLVNLQEKAVKEGFDLLLVFQVEVEQKPRTEAIENDCRVRLYLPGETKPIVGSTAVNNIRVSQATARGDTSEVDKVLRTFLTRFDEQVRLVEIPSGVTADLIKSSRLATLTSDKNRPILGVLTEILLYHQREFLTDAELETAFQAVVGESEGSLLAKGTSEERKAVLDKVVRAE